MSSGSRRPYVYRFILGSLLLALGAAGPATAKESLPPGKKLVGIEVHPGAIELKHRFDYVQILLTGRLDSGERVDVTRMADLETPVDLVEISGTGLVRPLGDGDGSLKIALAGQSATVAVGVSGQREKYTASYVRDVMPVLSRIGCNGGTCHGSLKGKNGFKLSLRGYDPLFDHRALTDDLKGRRFNRATPDRSLFLMKLRGAVPHEGGVLTRPGEPYYEILKSWVASGVPLDLESPRVVSLRLLPEDAVVPLPGMKQQMVVLATYSDGSERDVTVESFIESNNTEVIEVSERGLVTAVRRGESSILARYEGQYASTGFFVMGNREGYAWQDVPEYNHVDTLVYRKLRKIKSLPSDVCSDAEFLRRVYLDLTGLPPTSKDTRIFLADTRDSKLKRDELTDRLIGSSEFVEHWTNKWSDLLQVNSKFLGRQGMEALRNWIRQSVASNMPYDKFVYSILTASGSTLKNPPAAYYKVLREPDLVMENTTQLFLGIRFNCNKCHDHPFERWTQGNHWELAAYFAQVERKDAPGSPKMPRRSAVDTKPAAIEELVTDRKEGEISYEGRTVAPSFPYSYGVETPREGPRREILARWLTHPENPYFTRSFVNRLWSYFLGVGIIEPVDDIRASNPPTNPELLESLNREFVESGFDVRGLMRTICRSRVYQHSIRTNRWNEEDRVNFSHALARRLPAETLYDAIHVATGTTAKLPGRRRGTRAAEIPDPSTKLPDGFLDLFGRPPRESACECERSGGMSLGQALNLVNGPTVAGAVQDPENAISDLVSVERKDGRVVEELFLSILCRMPTAEEAAELVKTFDPGDPKNAEALPPESARELVARVAAWEKKQSVVNWSPLETAIYKSRKGATLALQEDGAILVSGENPDKDTYTVVAWTDLAGITGVRLEALPHESLARKGPGRADNGNFVLRELRVTAAPASDPSKAKAVSLQRATATFSQRDFSVERAADGKLEKGWAIAGQTGKPQRAVFETVEDFAEKGGTIVTFTLEQENGGKHTLGRFRLGVTTTPRPVRVRTLPLNVTRALEVPAEKRTVEQRGLVLRQYLGTDAEMRQLIRLSAAQDLTWALLNNPAFLFNR